MKLELEVKSKSSPVWGRISLPVVLAFVSISLLLNSNPVSGLSCEDDNCEGNQIYRNDFEHHPVGEYVQELIQADWGGAEGNSGVENGRVNIVEDTEQGKVLQVNYYQGAVGPETSGAQWKYNFSKSYNQIYVQYKLKFTEGFDFVKGGKLPGLVGGEANTGGNPASGTDGWSSRMMWTEGGKANFYSYHVDQPDEFGEYFPWERGQEFRFEPGEWHTVTHRIVMNTPGQKNGIMQGWFDGQLAFVNRGMQFRTVDDFAIDSLYFSTFFGGNTSDWAPPVNQSILFDDFIISTAQLVQPQQAPEVIPCPAGTRPGPYQICTPDTDIVIGGVVIKDEVIALIAILYIAGAAFMISGQRLKEKILNREMVES